MQRVTRADESCYFNYYFKKKEETLVLNAYHNIKNTYYFFLEKEQRLRDLYNELHATEYTNEDFWRTFHSTYGDVVFWKHICSITDPYELGRSENDYRWVYAEDVTHLFNLVLKLQHHSEVLIDIGSPISQSCALFGNENDRLIATIVSIRSNVAKRVLGLYQKLLEIFCKLCVGDKLFINALKKLNKSVSLPAKTTSKKRRV